MARLVDVLKFATHKTDREFLGRRCANRPDTKPAYFSSAGKVAQVQKKRIHWHGSIHIPDAIDADAYVRRLAYSLEDALMEFAPPRGSAILKMPCAAT